MRHTKTILCSVIFTTNSSIAQLQPCWTHWSHTWLSQWSHCVQMGIFITLYMDLDPTSLTIPNRCYWLVWCRYGVHGKLMECSVQINLLFPSGAPPTTIIWMVGVVVGPTNFLRCSMMSWIPRYYQMIMAFTTLWCVCVFTLPFQPNLLELIAIYFRLSTCWHSWTYCPGPPASIDQGYIQGPPCHLDQQIFGTWTWQAACRRNHCWYWLQVSIYHWNTANSLKWVIFLSRIACMPSFPALWQFPEGCGFKQWTGDNSKVLMKVSKSCFN